MKKYATTLILWASLLINELHTLFSNTKMVSVTGGQVPESWYVWLLSNSIWGVLIGLAIMLYQENRINRTSVMAYTLFCGIDLFMFLLNFKQHGYESIYTFLLIGWIIIYNYGTKNGQGGVILSEN